MSALARQRCLISMLLASLLALLAGSEPGSLHAQPGATGSYVPVATWDAAQAALPQSLWRDPAGLDVTPSGLVITSDASLRRIEIHDAAGNPIRQFGGPGGPGDLLAPGHLVADEGRDRLYVLDRGAGRAAVYQLDGTFLAHWSGLGGATGIAVDASGQILISDAGQDRVRIFQPDGSETGGWGGTGDGFSQFDGPAGLDVGPDGRIWVVDQGNARISGFEPDLSPARRLLLNEEEIEGALALDLSAEAGHVWVATAAGLAKLETSRGGLRGHLSGAVFPALDVVPAHGMFAIAQPFEGNPGIWRFRYNQGSGEPAADWASDGLVAGYYDGIETIAIGDDGAAYVLDVPERIQKLGLDGAPQAQILSPDPVEADANAAGEVFAVAGDEIFAYDAAGTEMWRTRVRSSAPNEDTSVVGLVWDAVAGKILALESGGKTLITVDPQGEIESEWTLRTGDSVNAVWVDLAVDSQGWRYALDAGHKELLAWDPSGRPQLELSLAGRPLRFDVATDGSLFVLMADGWIHKLDPAGNLLLQWDAVRLGLGLGSRPVDLALDAAGRVYVADGTADIVTVWDWDENAPRAVPPEVSEGCEVIGDKLAAPSEIPLGETVEVSLTVRGACAASRENLDIVVVVGPGVQESTFRAARKALESFVDQIDPSTDRLAIQPGSRTGGRLTGDVQRIRRSLRRMEPTELPEFCFESLPESLEFCHEAWLVEYLTEAEKELWSVRGRDDAQKVLITLLGGAYPANGRQPTPTPRGRRRPPGTPTPEEARLVAKAGQIKRRGGQIYVIGIGRDVSDKIMRDIATGPETIFKGRAEWQLARLYEAVSQAIDPSMLLRSLEIRDELPENMEYVPGSAQPPAILQGRVLVWRFVDVPMQGVGVRYRLKPTEAGEWPTNVEATGDYEDAAGDPGLIVFPVPRVRVIAPATPTPIPTPRPTATETPEPSATAPPTPRSEPGLIFLPLILRERCDPTKRLADVALVIDGSTSMGASGSDGRSKIEAAAAAAGIFLDALDPASDQAAVIVFNAEALVVQPLTNDRAALNAALAAIPLAGGSRIDEGIRAAAEELAGPRHRTGSQSTMILLTDGRASEGALVPALEAAEAAKEAGVTIYAIGLGTDLDVAALQRMASGAERYFAAPDAADLADIYAGIAGEIPCAPGAFWGQR